LRSVKDHLNIDPIVIVTNLICVVILFSCYTYRTQKNGKNRSKHGRFGTKTNENGQKTDIPVYFITDDECDFY
jgi:uncharacterized alpha/beta hydrolase family protein